MAKQIIDLGTSPNKGDGDPLRTAFDKVNDNFDELYLALGNPSGATTDVLPDSDATIDLGSAAKQWADLHVADFIYLNGARIEVTAGGALLVNGGAPAEVQDTVGSVFGDDSTLLVDGVNNIIPSANISGTEATNWDTAFSWGDHNAAGYLTDLIGDLQGSVFADDSTLLVDSIEGKIVGEVTGPISSTNWMAASDSYLTISNGGSTQPGPIQIVASANLDLAAGAGQVINANRNIVAAEGVTGNVTGDIVGSVFADDSSVMVDAVNNTMFAETLTTLGVFGNPTLSLNADFVGIDAQNGNLTLQTSDTIINNFVNKWEVQGISASMELTDDGVNSELGLNIDVVDFGTGNTIDMQNNTVHLTGATFTGEPWISLADLKTEVAASVDFTDFQTRIAAL